MNWKISKSNLHTTTTGRPINKAFKNKDGQTGDGLSCLISIVLIGLYFIEPTVIF